MHKTTQIKLYGDISSWGDNSAQEFIHQIERAAAEADQIDLHVHCYGGSVMEGTAIINAIRKCSIPIVGYIDGIAASMASILLMSLDDVRMSENAYLMLHAPAACFTSGRGTASEHKKMAKALDAMEDNFMKTLMARTGQAKSVVRGWMEGDNWFSATQALEVGLIDKIVDPIAGDVQQLDEGQVTASTVEQLYSYFSASLNSEGGEIVKLKIKEMEFKKELARVLKIEATADEKSIIEALKLTQPSADKVAILEKQVADFKAAEDDRNKAAIKAVIDKAIAERRITESDREEFAAMGGHSIAVLESVLSKMTAAKELPAEAEKGEGVASDPWSARLAEIESKNKTK